MQDSPVIQIHDPLDRTTVAAVVADLDSAISKAPARLVLDLGSVETFDSTGMGTVVEGLRRARERGVDIRLRGMSQPMLDFFSLCSVQRLTDPPRDRRPAVDLLGRIGALAEPTIESLHGIAAVGHETLKSIFVEPFRGKRLRLDRTALELDAAANGALPIIALIAFLLGLILAMQAYVQLRVWGAELYIADMVGVSTMTEIGPLMTAIVLAARSGSSNAAQLGSMVVAEEIDALEQMGVHPIRFLVAPKVVALSISVVALCLLFDVIAMCGGALFASLVAGIELNAYKEQTQQALKLVDFLVAVAKCSVFGACIGVVGCGLGLNVKGGSEGVGRATTDAVVMSVFLIIVFDAVFVATQRMFFA